MNIDNMHSTGASLNPAAASNIGSNKSSSSYEYDKEYQRLGRSITSRLDHTQWMIMDRKGSGTLNVVGMTNSLTGETSKSYSITYTAADVERAREAIPGQIYAMLLEHKQTADEGSVLMAVIDDWIAKLPSQYPYWSGKPSQVGEKSSNAHSVSKDSEAVENIAEKYAKERVEAVSALMKKRYAHSKLIYS